VGGKKAKVVVPEVGNVRQTFNYSSPNKKCFRYIEVFRSSMMEAQKSQIMGPGMRGAPRGGGGAMMRGSGGRPGPYDRMSGPPLGRGYGAYGPSARGSRSFKSKLIIKEAQIFKKYWKMFD
jgi:hypothetical protein